MTNDDGGAGGTRRRTLLKGLGVGALGVGGIGAALTAGPDVIRGGSGHDHEQIHRLVSTGDVTHRATGGRWAAADTWESDETPGSDARVLVPAETTVTLDHRDEARLRTVRVDGTLRVDPASDVALALDTLVVTDTGRLEIGTADAPIQPDRTTEITFVDRGEIDETWDPDRVSRGLLALHGSSISIHGAGRTGWDALADAPRAGARELRLSDAPTGWSAGDQLVVAGLHPENEQDEEVRVADVAGERITLDAPLEYDHVPPRSDLDAYVAHLDRNVQFRSESTVQSRRGHVMFMSTDVTVRNAGFYDLGRTEKARPFTDPQNGQAPADVPPNPQARYSCHFHRTGVDRSEPPRTVSGCVAWGSPGWGFVNHHSRVAFVENVSYEVFGAGFVAEIGTETGRFEGNFALRGRGSGRLPDSREFREGQAGKIDDFGHGGHGFWFQGPGCAVEDNVAGGHRHYGFVYWTRAKPDRSVPPALLEGVRGRIPMIPVDRVEGQPGLAESDAVENGEVPPSLVKLRSFRGNTVFGSGGGLDISRHRFHGSIDPVAGQSVVADFTAYNLGPLESPWEKTLAPTTSGAQGGNNGVSIRYSKQIQLRNVRLVAGAGDSRGVGINRNHATVTVGIEGADVEGFTVGIRTIPRGQAPISDATLDNEVNLQVPAGAADTHWAPQRSSLSDISFADGGRADVFVAPSLEGDLYGLFSPASTLTLDGEPLSHDLQEPDVVPIPHHEDLAALRGDSLRDLTDTSPSALVGKTNRELHAEFGIAVDGEILPAGAGRDPRVEGGYVAGGTGEAATRDGDALIEHVVAGEGSLFEVGRLAQGELLYLYRDAEFLAVPSAYAGLPYVRPESEDADGERHSYYRVRLASPATVYVAYDAETSAGWLGNWTATGTSLGTTDGSRTVYKRAVEAGPVTLGAAENTRRMYTVFAEPR